MNVDAKVLDIALQSLLPFVSKADTRVQVTIGDGRLALPIPQAKLPVEVTFPSYGELPDRCVPFWGLRGAVPSDGRVLLTAEDDRVRVTRNDTVVTLDARPATDADLVPPSLGTFVARFTRSEVALLKKTFVPVAKNAGPHETLKDIFLMDGGSGKAAVVAVDGRRMAWLDLDRPAPERLVRIPHTAFAGVRGSVQSLVVDDVGDGRVDLLVERPMGVKVRIEARAFTSNPVPRVDNLFPKTPRRVHIPVDTIQAAARVTARADATRMHFGEEGRGVVYVIPRDGGAEEWDIGPVIQVAGEPLRHLMFNQGYLSWMCAAADGGWLSIGGETEDGAWVAQRENLRLLLMPMVP